jgi:hypothetical protein
MKIYLDSPAINQTESLTLSGTSVLTWFNTHASSVYQNYINQLICQMDNSSATYGFCVQDTILSQSALSGHLTSKSSNDYAIADRVLSNKTNFYLIYEFFFFCIFRCQSSESDISNITIN